MTALSFDVLVITALFDELNAFLRTVDGGEETWVNESDPWGFPYHHRRIGSLRIAAAWAGEMGESATATRATALILHLNPACLAMCGICAGNRDNVFLGDVIVADRVYSYDHGKLVTAESPDGRREDFFHDIATYHLDAVWRTNVAYFARDPALGGKMTQLRPPSRARQEAWIRHRLFDHARGVGPAPLDDRARQRCCPDWTRRLKALVNAGLINQVGSKLSLTSEGERLVEEERVNYPDCPDGHPDDPPFRVHVGPIATGKTVRKDPEIFGRLERLVRKTIGIEMEAVAIGRVADEFHRKAIVVKAVSDYGDQDKDDAYRDFAARASAEILLHLLCHNFVDSSYGTTEPGMSVAHLGMAPPVENPFQTAGPLRPYHATYVVRSCDATLTTALEKEPLIAIEGDISTGKSSLALKAQADLARTHIACYIDLQGTRCDDEHILLCFFFDELSRQMGRAVNNWPMLDNGEGPPLALIIDEFGHLKAPAAPSFVEKLVHFATSRKDRVRVMTCVPIRTKGDSIESFLGRLGVADKYRWGWHRIPMSLLDADGIDHLLALLPERVCKVARELTSVVASLSRGHPMAVQRFCSALFDANAAGASIADLKAIVGNRRSYE